MVWRARIAAYGVNVVLFTGYVAYLIWRDKIDVKGMVRAVLKRK